jgi:Na+/melibiose symporter-like transporter
MGPEQHRGGLDFRLDLCGLNLSFARSHALTDRIDARRVYLAGALLAAISTLGFTLTADGFWTALAWRTLGGVGLAGTYMPG